jgi:hypothetical protein
MSVNRVVFNGNYQYNDNNIKENDIDVWVNNPTVLLDKNTLFEIWPTQKMCYERKINAMSRLIILLTILGFILTRSMKIVVVGFITLIVIYLFYYQNWYKYNRNNKEGFGSGDESSSDYTPIINVNIPNTNDSYNLESESNNQTSNTSNSTSTSNSNNENGTPLKEFVKDNYQRGTKTNPLGNVLLTDIMDNPDRLSASPSFNPSVSNDIRNNVKKMVQMLNPGIKCSDKQLFNNLYDNFDLDQSNRVFNATANTRVVNDQTAFGKWLYSNVQFSGKENTPEGAIARVQDNYRWTDP